jgi:hypothetical protein
MSNELDPLGGYRVGDAERTRTVDLLKEAHVAGYLTLPEIDERLSAALAARTQSDLNRLVADLPPDWRAQQAGVPAAPEPRPHRFREVAPQVLRVVPIVLIVAVVVLAISRGFFFFPWPLLWVFLIFGRHGRGGGRGGGGRGGGWQGRDPRRTTWV